VCGFTPSDPHHVFTGGMGTKCDDNLAIPLCHKHHTELHNNGKKSFAAKYNINYQEAIEILQTEYKETL
jgi:hypothetical protein